MEGAQVEAEALGGQGDLGGLRRIVGHDGPGAGGQQEVGHVVGGDIVGDTVDEGGGLPHRLHNGSVHAQPSWGRRSCQERSTPARSSTPRAMPARMAPAAVEMRKGTM